MTILIIGAGLVGLTTAYELLKRGEQVALVEGAESEALGASFANGGLLTPSMSDPWNTPGVHRHLADYLFGSHSALKIRWKAIPSLLGWGPRFLANSRPGPYRTATLANYELGRYSLAILDELRSDLALDFDAADKGTLKFFRSAQALDAAMRVTSELKSFGLNADELDRSAIAALEPCLAPIADQLVGAIHYPNDKSGDAFLFCQALAEQIRALGGSFHFGRTVRSIDVRGGKIVGVDAGDRTLPAERIVIAAATASSGLVRAFGARLAIKPVKGYSVTYSPDPSLRLPAIPVIDDAYHAAITPFGSRLRSVGTAEFAGPDLHLDRDRLDNLATFLKAIYPHIATPATLATGRPWAGLRPVAADGRPYVGAGPVQGLWINSGHGHLGWTLAAGSARLLADLMTGMTPAIAAEPYRVER